MFRLKTLAQTAAIALSVALPENATANSQIFVLSNAYPDDVAKTVGEQIASVLMELQPGDNMTLYDGPAQSEIARVFIPDDDKGKLIARSPGHKKKYLKSTAMALREHLVASVQAHASTDDTAPSMQVALPEVLDQLRYMATDSPEVVVIGSPRLHDPRAVEFSMAKGYPNDAHFTLDAGLSPYGQPSGGAALDGMQLHFCSTDEAWVKMPTHRNGVERALSLLVSGYDGKLATFSPNLPHCLERAAKKDGSNAKVFEIDPNVKQPAMVDASLALLAPATTAPEQLKLIATLDLTAAEQIDLQTRTGTGEVVMHSVWLYDTDSEDGDRVSIVSGNVSYEVPLRKQARKFAVPVTRGQLQIVGVKDGGGGITVGIRTEADDRLRTPVMQVGETIYISFAKS